MDFKKDQIFIITGASSGIGEATALLLNELGASIVAVARNEKRLQDMKNRCKFPQNVFLTIKDLSEDIENLPNFVKNLREKYGKFSGLAHCAGISALNPLKALNYSYAKSVFDVNFFAPLMLIKAVADRRNNVGSGASIVCVSSADALFGTKGQSVYAASKAALSVAIKAISKEITAQGMRINGVLPSMISTPMTENSAIKDLEYNKIIYDLSYPFGWGEAGDVAQMIAFLLSKRAKFISGQNYIIDTGGGVLV